MNIVMMQKAYNGVFDRLTTFFWSVLLFQQDIILLFQQCGSEYVLDWPTCSPDLTLKICGASWWAELDNSHGLLSWI